MKSAQILVERGIRSREQVIEKCGLVGIQIELFDLWMDWQKGSSYDAGYSEGKSQLQCHIKKLLDIEEND